VGILAPWVCDVKVDADAIHLQTVLEPSVCVRGAAERFCGAAWQAAADWGYPLGPANCRVYIGTAAVGNRRAGCQPAPHLQSDSTPMSHTPINRAYIPNQARTRLLARSIIEFVCVAAAGARGTGFDDEAIRSCTEGGVSHGRSPAKRTTFVSSANTWR